MGWARARNTRIDYRWGTGNADEMRRYAAELVTLAPDVLVATGGASVGPLLQATRTIPIVFANVPDPVGSGFGRKSFASGGNATGFVQFEYNLSGKWLEFLKQIAPNVTNAWRYSGINHTSPGWAGLPSFSPWRLRLGVEVSAINVRDAAEIERGVAAFAAYQMPVWSWPRAHWRSYIAS